MNIKFASENHKVRYNELCEKLKAKDVYRKTLAYLFALDKDCYRNINTLYDTKHRCIIPDGINSGWQTGTSIKTTRLAFNLFTDSCAFAEEINDNVVNYSVGEIFACCHAPYFAEAIKIRYPNYFAEC